MVEQSYKVVWPLGKVRYKIIPESTRITDLTGKTVCELSDFRFKAPEVFPLVEEMISKRYCDVKFISYMNFGDVNGTNEAEVTAALPEKLRNYGCDAVIVGVGG